MTSYGCAICDAKTTLPNPEWLEVVKGYETTWRCPEHKND